MVLIAVGHPHSPSVEAAKQWLGQEESALKTYQSLAEAHTAFYRRKDALFLPIYNQQQGFDYTLLQWLVENELYIADLVCRKDDYYLASRSLNFRTVVGNLERLALLYNELRSQRGLKIESTDTVKRALQRATQEEAAVVCTQAEAIGYRYDYKYKLTDLAKESRFAVVLPSLPKHECANCLVTVTAKRSFNRLLLTVSHYAETNGLEIAELITLPNAEEQQQMLIQLNADYRSAKCRKLFNQLKDLNLAEVYVNGAWA